MRSPLAFFMLACLGLAAPVSATVYNTNLLVNGDAESDLAGTGEIIPTLTGWTRSGGMTAVLYTAGGGFPDIFSPGPSVRGLGFFAGGPNVELSDMSQLIVLTDLQADIDLGHVNYELSGHLGGFAEQNDNARLLITFQDALQSDLATDSIGPVMAAERAIATGLLPRTRTALLPVGTRLARVRLIMTRTAGSYNDGYADSLAFTLRLQTLEVPTQGPARVQLMPVIPDPVRGRARFGFRLALGGHVRLDILDVQGRTQDVVLDGERDEGEHRVEWRPGTAVRPGMYFLRLQTRRETRIQRFVLLD